MERPLKIELHAHTKEDPKDKVKYSAEELIDRMAGDGYDVLSITNHNIVTYNSHLKNYAEARGILLIPGVEATIENKHVLLINVTDYIERDINTFDDLLRYKREGSLIMAPHPYYHNFTCIGSKLSEYINLFDAIEYCHYYIKYINPNLKAEKIAKKENIPLVGTSDVHFKHQIGKTYSLVKAKKDIDAIIAAIKSNKIEVVTTPLRYIEFFNIIFSHTGIRLTAFFRLSKSNGLSYCKTKTTS